MPNGSTRSQRKLCCLPWNNTQQRQKPTEEQKKKSRNPTQHKTRKQNEHTLREFENPTSNKIALGWEWMHRATTRPSRAKCCSLAPVPVLQGQRYLFHPPHQKSMPKPMQKPMPMPMPMPNPNSKSKCHCHRNAQISFQQQQREF